MVLCQMFLRFEELQHPFLSLVPVCALFLRDIPYMLSQTIPVWALQQISKFVEVQKGKGTTENICAFCVRVCVYGRPHMLIFHFF